jgi:molybdate transport system ATP-binding protein
MLEVKLKKRFPPRPGSPAFALDVAFSIAPGIHVLFGHSGAGKSLILDLIAGFAAPDEGRILLNDRLLADAATKVSLPPQQRNCGYVFQRPALFPHLTIRDNLFLPLAHRPKLERHRRTVAALEQFQLAEFANRYPGQLSGGQRQRAVIARALVTNPALLLLDEPTVGLDAALRQDFYSVVAQVRDEFNIPILIVTHDLEEAFILGESMLVCLDGRIVQTGLPRDILSRPATAGVARLLGAFNLLPAEILLLDPGQNRSRLRWNGIDLEGLYYPGRLIGDQVTLCIPYEEVRVEPKSGKAAKGQLVLELTGASERPKSALLEFAGGLCAEVSLPYYADHKHNREWLVQFTPASLRVLPRS